jgi:hypothetical protein
VDNRIIKSVRILALRQNHRSDKSRRMREMGIIRTEKMRNACSILVGISEGMDSRR